MVIGKGLIGEAFSIYKDNNNVLIFASGVSNSKNEIQSEFDREFELVKAQNKSTRLFVYFSTCSISDPSLKKSKYIEHKLSIEKYIQLNFESYLIIRLPNVIGKTKNPFTLTNFFFNSVLDNRHINIQKYAYRYLIEVNDVYKVVNALIQSGTPLNKVANLVISNKISALEIVHQFELFLNKKAQYTIIEGESDYLIEVDEIFKKYISDYTKDGITYFRKSILKTYPTSSNVL